MLLFGSLSERILEDDLSGTRTRNLRLRGLMPYPLDHRPVEDNLVLDL